MSIEREAVRHSEQWREAFRFYVDLFVKCRESYAYNSSAAEIAEKYADYEFGLYEAPKDKAP